MTAFSPATESRIRDIQAGKARRDAKRAEESAKELERRSKADDERRQSVSPREVEQAAKRQAAFDYHYRIYEQEKEAERQRKISKANPTLRALKSEYLEDKTTPSRRATLVSQFVELYRQAYGKIVPVDVLAKEWNEDRRKMLLQKVYGTTR